MGRAALPALAALLVGGTLVASEKLDVGVGAAMALTGALLVNPQSMLYDWGVAFTAVLLIRRAAVPTWLATDTNAGLLAMALFAAGQLSWSERSHDLPILPLTVWALALWFGLGLLTLLSRFRRDRDSEPTQSVSPLGSGD